MGGSRRRGRIAGGGYLRTALAAGDNRGAVAGPLLAAGLVGWVGIRPAFYFALIPGTGARRPAASCRCRQGNANSSRIRGQDRRAARVERFERRSKLDAALRTGRPRSARSRNPVHEPIRLYMAECWRAVQK
jgi:hypothetical protein